MRWWCNTAFQRVQYPDSPTPLRDIVWPYSPKEFENLQCYKEHGKDLATRSEGRFPIPDHAPYNEDLLRHTLEWLTHAAPHHKGPGLDSYSELEENSISDTPTGKEEALERERTAVRAESNWVQDLETH